MPCVCVCSTLILCVSLSSELDWLVLLNGNYLEYCVFSHYMHNLKIYTQHLFKRKKFILDMYKCKKSRCWMFHKHLQAHHIGSVKRHDSKWFLKMYRQIGKYPAVYNTYTHIYQMNQSAFPCASGILLQSFVLLVTFSLDMFINHCNEALRYQSSVCPCYCQKRFHYHELQDGLSQSVHQYLFCCFCFHFFSFVALH